MYHFVHLSAKESGRLWLKEVLICDAREVGQAIDKLGRRNKLLRDQPISYAEQAE